MAAMTSQGGSSRRRKNAQPRSILHTQADDGDEDESAPVTWFSATNDVTSLPLPVSHSTPDDFALHANEDEGEVLDLTVKTSTSTRALTQVKAEVTVDEHGVLDLTSHKRFDGDNKQHNGAGAGGSRKPWQQQQQQQQPGDSAMTDLLSTYGLDLHYTGPPYAVARWAAEPGQQQMPGYSITSSPVAEEEQDPYSLSFSSSDGAGLMDTDEQSAATLTLAKASSLTHKVINSVNRLVKSTHVKSAAHNLATSSSYIQACFDPHASRQVADVVTSSGLGGVLPDYSRYLRRYMSGEECGRRECVEAALREHFHCVDCKSRVIGKKEDMVRHYKWHKKRNDSLQHGFLRFSPRDDCSKKFSACAHNGRQTHYHCLQSGCSKVYISTSDVQMHSNFHRKDSAIIQEGFQRFRATEDCGSQACAFYGQRTTHFHCRRPACNFTFKNKADMEKHKIYHQRDEALTRDGFKKFMKYENCQFPNCRYSKLTNHIHCIRPGCNYVLHSTGQLYSHKRKHERRGMELAYKHMRRPNAVTMSRGLLASDDTAPLSLLPMMASQASQYASLMVSQVTEEDEEEEEEEEMDGGESDDSPVSPVDEHSDSNDSNYDLVINEEEEEEAGDCKSSPTEPNTSDAHSFNGSMQKLCKTKGSNGNKITSSASESRPQSSEQVNETSSPVEMEEGGSGTNTSASTNTNTSASTPAVAPADFVPTVSRPAVNGKKERDETWKRFLTRFTANDPCHAQCPFLYKDHYHCNTPACRVLFRTKDGVRDHARCHQQQDQVTAMSYDACEAGAKCRADNCTEDNSKKHYHCRWPGCAQVLREEDGAFSRLEHNKIHMYARTSVVKKVTSSSVSSAPSAVPAHPVPTFTFPFSASSSSSRRRGRPPKYPRNDIPLIPKLTLAEAEIAAKAKATGDPILASGFQRYGPDDVCPDELCMYKAGEHFHCVRARCHHSTNHSDVLSLHAKDFHMYITIMEGFEYFDSNVSCRRSHCANNRVNRHFHCTRPGCDYAFVRYSTMVQHNRKHIDAPRHFNIMAASRPRVAEKGQGQGQPVAFGAGDLGKMLAQYNGGASLSSQALLSGGVMMPMLAPLLPANNIPPSLMSQYGLPAKMAIPRLFHKKKSASASQPRPIAPKPESSSVDAAASLTNVKDKMHFAITDNCGRPFCKLKKRDHFHCVLCNQAFSDSRRLTYHLAKHNGRQHTMTSQATDAQNNELQDVGWEEPSSGEEEEEEVEDAEDGEEGVNEAAGTSDWQVPSFNLSHSLNLDPRTFSGLSHAINPMSFSGLIGSPQVLNVDSDNVGLDLSAKLAGQLPVAMSKLFDQSQTAIKFSGQSQNGSSVAKLKPAKLVKTESARNGIESSHSVINGKVTSAARKRKLANGGAAIATGVNSGDFRQMVTNRLHQHLNKERTIKHTPSDTAMLNASTIVSPSSMKL